MSRWTMLLQDFSRDDRGATAIEYSLIAAFIAIIIVGSVQQVGGGLDAIFQSIQAGFG